MENHSEVLQNALKDYLSAVGITQAVGSWNEVFRHLLALRPDLGNLTWYFDAIPCLLNFLLQPDGCRSKDAVSRILQAHCECLYDQSSFEGDSVSDRFENALLGSEAAILSTPEDYWSRSRGRYGEEFLQEYFQYQFTFLDLQWMSVLVTYGIPIPLDMETQKSMFVEKCSDTFIILGVWGDIPYEVLQLRMCLTHFTLRQKLSRMDSENQRGINRILYIVLSLHAAVKDSAADARMVKAYLGALPDPLVSEEEVRELLLFMLKDQPNVDVERIVDAFVEVFGRRAYEPRSLSHLCRLKVRDTIVRNSSLTLPASVRSLNLPKLIQKFILCQS